MQTETLENLCDLIVDCPHFTPRWTDRGVIVTRNQNIRNGRLDLSSPSYTDEDTYKKRIRRATPSEGDLIFTREAPMGEICMIPKGLKCCLGQRQVLLRPNKDIDGRYLLYAMQSKYVLHQVFWSEGTGSTISNVRLPDLKALKVPRNQHSELAIAKTLGALDDKIENNRQMNETLEEMAHAIFKSWFVDFDPVHAKAAGNAPAHMDAETAALFPNSFGDDGLPVGWSVGKIEDIVDRQRAGKLFSKKTVDEEGKVPVLDQSAADIIGYHNEHPSVLADPTDRVITFANHTCALRLIDFNFSAIQNVIPFKGKNYPTEWVLFASHNKQKFEEYKGHWPTFMVQPVIVPDDDTSSAFAKLVEPMVSKISTNKSQNKTLVELRDTLLPKLMSGEIRVKDAEREVEAAI